ncbi:MAG: hypothetical protein L6R28_25350 [Planctomycetes bacterium]|nr:hypothetical protein [Planctomycetota bacterium]
MLFKLLILAAVVYLAIGVALAAFCIHMSYHEAAVGFGDSEDAKAQRVLESRIGFFGYLFLVVSWPLALLISFMPKPQDAHAKADSAAPAAAPSAAQEAAQKNA